MALFSYGIFSKLLFLGETCWVVWMPPSTSVCTPVYVSSSPVLPSFFSFLLSSSHFFSFQSNVFLTSLCVKEIKFGAVPAYISKHSILWIAAKYACLALHKHKFGCNMFREEKRNTRSQHVLLSPPRMLICIPTLIWWHRFRHLYVFL